MNCMQFLKNVIYKFLFVEFKKYFSIFLKKHSDKTLEKDKNQKIVILEAEVKRLRFELEAIKNKNSEVLKHSNFGQFTTALVSQVHQPTALIGGQVFKLKKLINQASRSQDPFELRDIVTQKMTEPLDKILSLSIQVVQEIQSMKDFSEQGSAQEVFQNLNIKESFDVALGFINDKIIENSVKLKYSINENIVCEAQINNLTQVFYNFLKNSLDAVNSEPVKEIHIQGREENSMVMIEIKDSSNRSWDQDPQTSLSYAITSEIIALHQGSLQISKQPDAWVTYLICLPCFQMSSLKQAS